MTAYCFFCKGSTEPEPHKFEGPLTFVACSPCFTLGHLLFHKSLTSNNGEFFAGINDLLKLRWPGEPKNEQMEMHDVPVVPGETRSGTDL